jgi:hypothetical protein
MKTLKLRLIFLGFLVPALLAGAEESMIDRHAAVWQLAPGQTVSVMNPFGDVRLRFGGHQGTVELAAACQQLRIDGVQLAVLAAETDAGLSLVIDWDTKPGQEPPPRPDGDLTRCDLAVLVPAGVRAEVTTTSGLIQAKGLTSDIVVRSASGEITFGKIRGSVTAQSDTGAIRGTLLSGVTGDEQRFVSSAGPVEIWVEERVDAVVRMATSGTVTTDFSLEITHHDDKVPSKSAVARIGEISNRTIVMEGRRSDLSLRRVPIPVAASAASNLEKPE